MGRVRQSVMAVLSGPYKGVAALWLVLSVHICMTVVACLAPRWLFPDALLFFLLVWPAHVFPGSYTRIVSSDWNLQPRYLGWQFNVIAWLMLSVVFAFACKRWSFCSSLAAAIAFVVFVTVVWHFLLSQIGLEFVLDAI